MPASHADRIGSGPYHSAVSTSTAGAYSQAPGTTHPDTPALDLLAGVLGSGRASRLYRAVRERRLASLVSAYNYTPTEIGVFVAHAETPPGSAADAARAMWDQIRAVREGDVGEREIERAKRVYESQWVRRLEDMEGQANYLAEWEALGDWRMGDRYLERLLSTTRDDLDRTVVIVHIIGPGLDAQFKGLVIGLRRLFPSLARIKGPAQTEIAHLHGRFRFPLLHDLLEKRDRLRESAMVEEIIGADIAYGRDLVGGGELFQECFGRLADIIGTREVGVISDHHQAIRYLAPGFVLTSMLKRADIAVYETISKLVKGDLKGGTALNLFVTYTFAYGLTRKAQFRRFPEDGRVEIDNNSVHAEATCAYWWPPIIS